MIAEESALTKPLRYANEYDVFDTKKETAMKNRHKIGKAPAPVKNKDEADGKMS